MYGLPSRESLSKRQSRWLRAVDEDVRSNPAQNAFNRETPSNSIRDKSSIITVMNDIRSQTSQVTNSNSGQENSILGGQSLNTNILRPFNNHLMGIIPENSADDLSQVQSFYDETRKKYTKLEQDYESLKQTVMLYKSVDELVLPRIQKLEQFSEYLLAHLSGQVSDQNTSFPNISLFNRISKLEQQVTTVANSIVSEDFSSLSKRVSFLEASLSEISSIGSYVSQPIKTLIPENSSEFSALTGGDIDLIRNSMEFVPYIIKEDYASCDNITKLTGNPLIHFEMLVEILGFYSETPVIFPFGIETNLPRYAELTLEMSFKDADKTVNGTAYGIFKRRNDGIYIIQLTELYSDGNASGIERYTLPLTFTCNTDLLLE